MSGAAVPRFRELAKPENELYPHAWGVFGDQDQLGTLNHLTPARVLQALASVKTGEVVNLNLSLSEFNPPLIAHRGVPQHQVFGLNEFHRDDRLDGLFMQASTQLDGLRHFAHPDKGFYNGFTGDQISAGTAPLGIQNLAAKGIVGRGLLLDVAEYRKSVGRPIATERNDTISVADLEATIAFQGSTLLAGDILMLRTGWLQGFRAEAASRVEPLASPGLEQSIEIAEWLWDSQVSVVAADNIALEAWPVANTGLSTTAEEDGRLVKSSHTGMLHRILIPLLGMTIGELWDLEELAARCRERSTFDCLITAEPLNVLGGVGSPANALAII